MFSSAYKSNNTRTIEGTLAIAVGAALLLARGWKERLGNLELYER
jgi:hypothetical protein